MSKIEEKIKEMGLTLPEAHEFTGFAFVSARRFGENLVYISGSGPSVDGSRIEGKLGENVTVEQGYEYAKGCMLNILAALKKEIGDLDKVKRAVKVTCFVASTPDFYQQPQVANGGTQLLIDLYGRDVGAPTRSAVGMCVLPGNMPVETEAIFEVE